MDVSTSHKAESSAGEPAMEEYSKELVRVDDNENDPGEQFETEQRFLALRVTGHHLGMERRLGILGKMGIAALEAVASTVATMAVNWIVETIGNAFRKKTPEEIEKKAQLDRIQEVADFFHYFKNDILMEEEGWKYFCRKCTGGEYVWDEEWHAYECSDHSVKKGKVREVTGGRRDRALDKQRDKSNDDYYYYSRYHSTFGWVDACWWWKGINEYDGRTGDPVREVTGGRR